MSLDLLKLRSSDELMVSYFSVEKENQFLFYFNEKTFQFIRLSDNQQAGRLHCIYIHCKDYTFMYVL